LSDRRSARLLPDVDAELFQPFDDAAIQRLLRDTALTSGLDREAQLDCATSSENATRSAACVASSKIVHVEPVVFQIAQDGFLDSQGLGGG
jgi:hypothetical protein